MESHALSPKTGNLIRHKYEVIFSAQFQSLNLHSEMAILSQSFGIQKKKKSSVIDLSIPLSAQQEVEIRVLFSDSLHVIENKSLRFL